MNKIILMMTCLMVSVFSDQGKIEPWYIKVKAVEEDGNIRTKIGYKKTKEKSTKEEYISHVTAKVGDTIIFDMSMSSVIAENPHIQFKFDKNIDGDTVDVIITDNKGKSYEGRGKKFNHITDNKLGKNKIIRFSEIDFKKTYPRVWDEANLTKAITKFYGTQKFINENILVCAPNHWAMRGFNVPVQIKSSIDLESIAIFGSGNDLATIAVISIPNHSIIDYSFRINLKRKGKIVVVGKGRDGKLYKNVHYLSVAMSGEFGDIKCHY